LSLAVTFPDNNKAPIKVGMVIMAKQVSTIFTTVDGSSHEATGKLNRYTQTYSPPHT